MEIQIDQAVNQYFQMQEKNDEKKKILEEHVNTKEIEWWFWLQINLNLTNLQSCLLKVGDYIYHCLT